ncbi:glycosyltransferase [bacterium]|nr:MAG: glycosyltransferase [bacterium]
MVLEVFAGGSLKEAWRVAAATNGINNFSFWMRSRIARRHLRRRGPFDLVVQGSSDFRCPASCDRVATFEDMTVALARREPTQPRVAKLSERRLGVWKDNQSAVYEMATACCITSSWAARSIESDYDIESRKIHAVGIGANRRMVCPEDRDWSSPRFLFVGLDWTRKGGDTLVQAFAKLHEHLPLARLELVGVHPEIQAPGVRTHGVLRLDHPEERARLDDLFSEATCFVMPSVFEPSAIVFAEAAQVGIPSIGSTAGGSATIIGGGGLLVAPRDVEGLLAAMLELSDPVRAREVGGEALARAPSLTWEAVTRRILAASGLPSSSTTTDEWATQP